MLTPIVQGTELFRTTGPRVGFTQSGSFLTVTTGPASG